MQKQATVEKSGVEVSEKPTQETGISATPTYSDFLCYKVDPTFRRLSQKARRTGVEQFQRCLQQYEKKLDVRFYSCIGFREDVEFFVWVITKKADEIQEIVSDIYRAGLGHYLSLNYAFMSVTKTSNYSKSHPQNFELGPSPCKYLFVYPFIKTHDWYLLPFEVRQRMMAQHFQVGRDFPQIKLNTMYSFGLGDQDFMLAFEGNDLKEFSDLVQQLRETEARKYTVKDTPLIVGTKKTLDELLYQLALI